MKVRNQRPPGKNRRYSSHHQSQSHHHRRQGSFQGGKNFRRKVRVSELSPDALIKRFGRLFELYVKARSELFAQFNRVDGKRRKELQQEWMNTRQNIEKFEFYLSDAQVDFLNDYFCVGPLDLSYSGEEENLPPQDQNVAILDPHLIPNQLDRPDYRDDTEESVGTLRDLEFIRQKPA